MRPSLRPPAVVTLGAVLALVPALAVSAAVQRQTSIISPPSGETAQADGPSDNTAFSQDNRVVRLVAYDSAAKNLVAGDSNGKRDVFVLARVTGDGALTGTLSRVSVSSRGKQANGDSTKPSIDGEGSKRPHCVTFESKATNLDRGDRSSDSDIYLRDLRSRRTSLISIGHRNATNGVVDGSCEFITYEARGYVFVRDLVEDRTTRIAQGSNPDQQTNGKGVAYERRGQIYHQAYQRVFNSGDPTVKRIGREVLASAGSAKGNGVSRNPSLDDNGFYVAFESTATNLCVNLCKGVSTDGNGTVSDVFRRTLSSRAPTKDRMQMVSYSFAVNEQGNGPSRNPAMTGAGENILFDSEATNLRQSAAISLIDPNGPVRDIYYWNFPRVRQEGNVSRESRPGAGTEQGGFYNGASTNPSTSNRANYIGFTSTQTGLSGEANGPSIADVFMRYLGAGPEATE